MSDEAGGAGGSGGSHFVFGDDPAWDDTPPDLTWGDADNSLTLEKLEGDYPLGKKERPVRSDRARPFDEQERQQVLEFRETLFRGVNGLVYTTTIAGIVLMAAYMVVMVVMGGDLDYRVFIAWYSSMAVQTIGLLAVIAKNLFPNGNSGNKR